MLVMICALVLAGLTGCSAAAEGVVGIRLDPTTDWLEIPNHVVPGAVGCGVVPGGFESSLPARPQGAGMHARKIAVCEFTVKCDRDAACWLVAPFIRLRIDRVGRHRW